MPKIVLLMAIGLAAMAGAFVPAFFYEEWRALAQSLKWASGLAQFAAMAAGLLFGLTVPRRTP